MHPRRCSVALIILPWLILTAVLPSGCFEGRPRGRTRVLATEGEPAVGGGAGGDTYLDDVGSIDDPPDEPCCPGWDLPPPGGDAPPPADDQGGYGDDYGDDTGDDYGGDYEDDYDDVWDDEF